MKTTSRLRAAFNAVMVTGFAVLISIASPADAAAQFGGERHTVLSPIGYDFVGDWLWAAPRVSCGSVVNSFGNKPVVADGKTGGPLCQFPIDQLEKIMNGRGRLWLKTFGPDDAISPKWTCGVSLGATITRSGVKTFIQRADKIVMWFENSQTPRYIYTDGRRHPPATDLFYWGHSIGWMEGETFVVETTNFTFDVDGYDDQSHMARSHLAKWIERYTMKGKDSVEVAFIIEDPVFLREKFTFVGAMKRAAPDQVNNVWECDPEDSAREIYSTFKNPYPDDNTAERFFGIK